jgi:hypothetical protein
LQNGVGSVASRKILTTYVTVTVSSLVLASFFLINPSSQYNLGNQLMALSFVYGMYIGAIVLFYGNTVSIVLEYIQDKWFKFPNWIFILLHGLFGLANGLLFQSVTLAMYGMVVASFYAIVDRWLFATISRHHSLKAFLIVPVLLYGLSWGLLQLVSSRI